MHRESKSERLWGSLLGLALGLALGLGVSGGNAWAQDEDRTLIRAKHIYTVDGDVISPGEVLIKDGKIAYVGPSIELGLPAKEVSVDTLIPGIINASSSAGLSGGSAEVSREVTPDFDTQTAIDWLSRDFAEALDQGVTTLQILPATENVFAGYACVVKSQGDLKHRVVDDQHGVVLAMSSDPTSRNSSRTRPDSIFIRQPTNRMGVVWIVRNTFHQTRQGEAAVGLDLGTRQILAGILDGQRTVLSASRTDFDIRSSLQLGRDFGYQPVIYGGDEVYRMLDEFAESKASLVYTALTTTMGSRALRGREGTELRWNIPGQLSQAGIRFCLAGDDLLEQARFAYRFGLQAPQALAAVTLGPAQILGLDHQLGSIRVGKDADLVALSGDPLQPTSAIEWTMVGGKIYDHHKTQP